MSAELFDRLQDELANLEEASGLSMTSIFMLPKALTRFLSWMIRQKGANLEDVATYFEQNEDAVLPLLQSLVSRGYIEEEEGTAIYRVCLGSSKRN